LVGGFAAAVGFLAASGSGDKPGGQISTVPGFSPKGDGMLSQSVIRLRPSADSGLYICAEDFADSPDDLRHEFANGPIVVPVGTVFDWGGHMFNGPGDPEDHAHMGKAGREDGRNWPGIPVEDENRRNALRSTDLRPDHPEAGAITTQKATLTVGRRCMFVSARPIISKEWKWSQSSLNGDASIFYQVYGVVRNNRIDTSFDREKLAFKWAAQTGSINAEVEGKIGDAYSLPPDHE